MQNEGSIPDSSTIKCSAAIPYPTESGQCQAILEDVLLSMNCNSEGSPLVLRDEEVNARLLITALNQSPNPECTKEALPLLCMDLFGLCDSSGVSIQPTSSQCKNVRDNVCRLEWEAALALGFELPDCESFPEEQEPCTENEINSTSNGKTLL